MQVFKHSSNNLCMCLHIHLDNLYVFVYTCAFEEGVMCLEGPGSEARPESLEFDHWDL